MQEDCRMRFYVNDKIENQFENLLEIIRQLGLFELLRFIYLYDIGYTKI